MDLRSIFVSNGTGVLLLLIMIYASHYRIRSRHLTDRVYMAMIYGVILGCFFEAFSYMLDGRVFPGCRVISYIMNTYLYTANWMLALCVLLYADLRLYDDPKRIREKYKPQFLIGILLCVINLVNFFWPISYYINEQNVYERRPLSYIFFLVILYYCFCAMRLTRKYEKENGRPAFFRIEVFLVPILLGAGIQYAVYGMSLGWLASAIGLTGLYMMQQNELSYVDGLCGIYNRQYLNQILSDWMNRDEPFAGALVDIDHFKQINDQYGHSEGDNALKTLADTLKEARHHQEVLFRLAGDEFLILKAGASEAALESYMAEVCRLLRDLRKHPFPIQLSYGISLYQSGEVDSFLKAMDTKMYQMKEEHHTDTGISR